MPDDTILAALDGGGLTLASFDCRPQDRAWQQPNVCGPGHVIAFPHVPVGIHMEGRGALVADANRVVLYDPRTRYERHMIDPRGDRCTYVAVRPDLMQQLAPPVFGGRRRRFRTDHVEVVPDHVLRIRVLAERVRCGAIDLLTVEEELLRLVLDVLGVEPRAPAASTAGTRRSHRRLAEDARAWVAAHAFEQWILADLGAAVHTAPAHLHRVFRRLTGMSVHEHRDRLRVARALDMVLDGADDLAGVASTVGYSSHSHFTRRFRRTFGATPSQVRARVPRRSWSSATTG